MQISLFQESLLGRLCGWASRASSKASQWPTTRTFCQKPSALAAQWVLIMLLKRSSWGLALILQPHIIVFGLRLKEYKKGHSLLYARTILENVDVMGGHLLWSGVSKKLRVKYLSQFVILISFQQPWDSYVMMILSKNTNVSNYLQKELKEKYRTATVLLLLKQHRILINIVIVTAK